MRERTISTFIVSARSDGRGGIPPFGTYTKAEAGAKCKIGDNFYTVTKDGRVNIPKSIMDTGVRGKDGRMRIAITFSSIVGSNGQDVRSVVTKPLKTYKNNQTGSRITKSRESRKGILLPSDSDDANWSPQ